MELSLSQSQMKTVRHQFDSLCRKVLREESRNIEKQSARRSEKEICFSALSEAELNTLYKMDDYPSNHTCFDVLDYRIVVKDERLAEALAALSAEKRGILLLTYFLGMNDREIAEALSLVTRTVQRRRTKSIEELRTRMEIRKDETKTE